ncbi:hypothetical protein F4778DRAFT_742051 [Xylariomycetidae sp. FL2044]|nr:hypothetical protein F4778DRAFT_742051 [Xylariomycetidae sp. FL2044]
MALFQVVTSYIHILHALSKPRRASSLLLLMYLLSTLVGNKLVSFKVLVGSNLLHSALSALTVSTALYVSPPPN